MKTFRKGLSNVGYAPHTPTANLRFVKGYDPTLIEDPAPFTMEISKYQKYGELLKNSVESYPMRDKIVFVMKDMAWVEQAMAMGAVVRATLKE